MITSCGGMHDSIICKMANELTNEDHNLHGQCSGAHTLIPMLKPNRRACTWLIQLTMNVTSVSRKVRYLKDHYAQQVGAPKELEGGRNSFMPSCSMLGHLGTS